MTAGYDKLLKSILLRTGICSMRKQKPRRKPAPLHKTQYPAQPRRLGLAEPGCELNSPPSVGWFVGRLSRHMVEVSFHFCFCHSRTTQERHRRNREPGGGTEWPKSGRWTSLFGWVAVFMLRGQRRVLGGFPGAV